MQDSVQEEQQSPGIRLIKCENFIEFVQCIDNRFKTAHNVLWRGQGDSAWFLESSLERRVRNVLHSKDPEYGYKGGATLPDSVVKRNGTNAYQSIYDVLPRFPELCTAEASETMVWTNARHFGMITPLLDWTRSPYVAAFFAFADVDFSDQSKMDGEVAIWGMHCSQLRDNVVLVDAKEAADPKYFFNLVLDRSTTNRRMHAQQGVFTYVDPPLRLEALVKARVEKATDPTVWLEKIVVPKKSAGDALIHLNRMNINFTTVYPDFNGACLNANMSAMSSSYEGRVGRGFESTPGFEFMRTERNIGKEMQAPETLPGMD